MTINPSSPSEEKNDLINPQIAATQDANLTVEQIEKNILINDEKDRLDEILSSFNWVNEIDKDRFHNFHNHF